MAIINKDKKINDSSVSFSVDSQLIGELGERLVTSNYIALAELIKNAYDADSPRVIIKLINVSGKYPEDGEPTIIIKDFGLGMSLSQIREFWMKIATTNKSKNALSKIYGRPTTGNKGIGRFACQKLAESLEIECVAKVGSSYEYTTVSFIWSEFVPGTDIDTIPCKYTTRKSKSGVTGVTLKLVGVREKWTPRDYKMLQKNIALISIASASRRKGFQEDPGFKVVAESKEFEQGKVNIGKNLLNAGWGRLEGAINSAGILNLTLECKDEKKNPQYSIPGHKNLAGLDFEVYIIPGASRYSYIENRRDPNLLTAALRSEIWEQQGGIRLYLNKFRIYPYGDIEYGDDWLGIARDIGKRRAAPDPLLESIGKSLGVNLSRAMLNHPAAQALIGAVNINGKATQAFVAKMDREGLLENQSFRTLKKLLRLSLDWAALHNEAFIRKEVFKHRDAALSRLDGEKINTASSPKEKVNYAINVIKQAALTYSEDEKTSVPAVKENASTRITSRRDKKLDEQLSAASSVIESQFDALDAELTTLRSVASTAPLLFVFSHEFKGILSTLLSHAAKLENIAPKINEMDIRESLLKLAGDARSATAQYEKITKLFDVFSDSQNFQSKKYCLKLLLKK